MGSHRTLWACVDAVYIGISVVSNLLVRPVP